jgi:molybdopterin converting factor small subunit
VRVRPDPASHAAPARAKVLVLAGPVAVASVVGVALSGAHLGATPAPGAQASTFDAANAVHDAGALTSTTIGVRVRVSAALQEMTGAPSVNLTLPQGSTVGTLLNRLSDDYPALAMMGPSVMVAVSDEMAWPDHALASGDVVDLVSQMAGG